MLHFYGHEFPGPLEGHTVCWSTHPILNAEFQAIADSLGRGDCIVIDYARPDGLPMEAAAKLWCSVELPGTNHVQATSYTALLSPGGQVWVLYNPYGQEEIARILDEYQDTLEEESLKLLFRYWRHHRKQIVSVSAE